MQKNSKFANIYKNSYKMFKTCVFFLFFYRKCSECVRKVVLNSYELENLNLLAYFEKKMRYLLHHTDVL